MPTCLGFLIHTLSESPLYRHEISLSMVWHTRAYTELPRARVRSPSPPLREHARLAPLEGPRRKEQEKVEVPAYPEITKLMTWKTSLARAVMIAANSQDTREVMRWVSAS